jgi:hypothetical protein
LPKNLCIVDDNVLENNPKIEKKQSKLKLFEFQGQSIEEKKPKIKSLVRKQKNNENSQRSLASSSVEKPTSSYFEI